MCYLNKYNPILRNFILMKVLAQLFNQRLCIIRYIISFSILQL